MTTATVDPTRLAEIVRLDAGAHVGPTLAGGSCVTEAAAYVAGESWTDEPACVCPVVAAYARQINDRMDDAERQRLIPYVARIVGTRVDAATQRRRAYLCADHAVRVFAPLALDAAGLAEHADRLLVLPPVTDAATARGAAATTSFYAYADPATYATFDARSAAAAATDAVTYAVNAAAAASAATYGASAATAAASAAAFAADATAAREVGTAASSATNAWSAALALLDALIAASPREETP